MDRYEENKKSVKSWKKETGEVQEVGWGIPKSQVQRRPERMRAGRCPVDSTLAGNFSRVVDEAEVRLQPIEM